MRLCCCSWQITWLCVPLVLEADHLCRPRWTHLAQGDTGSSLTHSLVILLPTGLTSFSVLASIFLCSLATFGHTNADPAWGETLIPSLKIQTTELSLWTIDRASGNNTVLNGQAKEQNTTRYKSSSAIIICNMSSYIKCLYTYLQYHLYRSRSLYSRCCNSCCCLNAPLERSLTTTVF